MKITDALYNEIQSFDPYSFLTDVANNTYLYDERLTIVDEVNSKDQFGKSFKYLNEDELDELNHDNVIRINAIEVDTMLFEGLRCWFGGFLNVEDGVRAGHYSDGVLYYGTGIGYDTISSDLLGCYCDGIVKNVFISFCNEDWDVMKKGGYHYIHSNMKNYCYADKLKTLLAC